MGISTATIAYGTIIGMIGALGSFLISFGIKKETIIIRIFIYILSTMFFILWLRRKTK